MRYLLETREHPEYGAKGLVILGSKRNYLEPGEGNVVAHDLLEHATKPHPNKFIDEFIALGGILFVRIETGYQDGTRYLNLEDLAYDICQVVYEETCENPSYPSIGPGLRNYKTRNICLLETVRSCVAKSRVIYQEEYGHSYNQRYNNPSIIEGWVCKGYQLAKKRFNRVGLDACEVSWLFGEIEKACNQVLKTAEIGQRFYLNLSLERPQCYITEEE